MGSLSWEEGLYEAGTQFNSRRGYQATESLSLEGLMRLFLEVLEQLQTNQLLLLEQSVIVGQGKEALLGVVESS